MEIDVSKLNVLKSEEQKIEVNPINIVLATPKKEPEFEQQIIIIESPPEKIIEEPQVITQTVISEDCKNEHSITDTIETGSRIVVKKKKPKPQFASPLFKESFLAEFRTEIEKQKVRENLGVYSISEINKSLNDIDDRITKILSKNLSNYITEDTLKDAIADLNFVTASKLKQITYNIPSNI